MSCTEYTAGGSVRKGVGSVEGWVIQYVTGVNWYILTSKRHRECVIILGCQIKHHMQKNIYKIKLGVSENLTGPQVKNQAINFSYVCQEGSGKWL